MDLEKYDYILSVGTFFEDENLKNSLEKACKNEANFIFMHPIDKYILKELYKQFIKYEVGSEEAILALILYFFAKKDNSIKEYLENLDIGYLSAESSAGEDEFEDIFSIYEKASKKALILGDDLLNHKNIENILTLVKSIEKYTDFSIFFSSKELENSYKSSLEKNLEEPEDLESFNGTILYFSKNCSLNEKILASQTFLNIAKVKSGDMVSYKIENISYKKEIILDENLFGTIAITNKESNLYSFCKVALEKE
ncbi:hypothetical protein CRU87_08835 [Aliarcobacter trophiarum LMG 25534]|uniref:NADH:quinone oxidoreductase I, chain G-like protein n=1 Tax=Aliarcobacter trophiarum LMG 25534 TaxID=1032241 RepID=A0AAD0VMZ2_9BACT|nr:hypothetical protein [Aliarcobacter trophiarum]AXK49684.1 NADH:quinone oxidoreductase I, chain G-like protein [Aliarcobacter trophiarum LMG 25534]RXI25758.1 hypothetical protein CRU89_07420 [Aliarcobacter trophiarum]RXJ89599.1 hypothetical protein CRU87_08835 [Aliarcobacter trophiarum LMG 25534]